MNKNTLKNKAVLALAPIVLRPKTIRCKCVENMKLISCLSSSLKFLTSSTFNVIYINTGHMSGYFRECRKHTDKFSFLSTVLSDYFSFIYTGANRDKVQDELLSYLSNKYNLKKFWKMGILNDEESIVKQLFSTNQFDSELLGIPRNHSSDLDGAFRSMIQYVWGEIYAYKLNAGLSKNTYQTFNANRQLATNSMAQLLNCEELFPNVQYVKLSIDGGYERIGTLMGIAPGISPESIDEQTRRNITPNIQRQMSKMEMIDVLCWQKDHRPGHDGNYNVVLKQDALYSVSAFDNDSPTSFFPSPNVRFVTSAKTTPYINRDGIIDRLYIDKVIVDSIKSVTFRDIWKAQFAYLNAMQIFFLICRLEKIKKAIALGERGGILHVLDYDEWNNETINQEIMNCRLYEKASYLFALVEILY